LLTGRNFGESLGCIDRGVHSAEFVHKTPRGHTVFAYVIVFSFLAALLLASLILLYRIDVSAFRKQTQDSPLVERVALAAD